MSGADRVVITGAFSYTGKYVTRRLLDRGKQVATLTNHPQRKNPFGKHVTVHPYSFEDPARLRETLRGASTLINTYWVRFPHGNKTFEMAVENTRRLIRAAREVGVRRIVHISIANPSLDSPLGYYKGKAELEELVKRSGMPYTILRPTVIFGKEDILINNIAWFVRRFPVFGIPGDGRYRVQPIYVEDMAHLIVDAVSRKDSYVLNAVGPETFTFEELVKLVGEKIGRRARVVHLPARLAYLLTWLTGYLVRDVVLTWEEYLGLMDDLLAVNTTPPGWTRLSAWLTEHAKTVGTRYHSELARHFR